MVKEILKPTFVDFLSFESVKKDYYGMIQFIFNILSTLSLGFHNI